MIDFLFEQGATREHIRAICDRGATQFKRKSGATRRARAVCVVWRRCSLLIPQLRDGYARRSRLAIRPKLLWRGQRLIYEMASN